MLVLLLDGFYVLVVSFIPSLTVYASTPFYFHRRPILTSPAYVPRLHKTAVTHFVEHDHWILYRVVKYICFV